MGSSHPLAELVDIGADSPKEGSAEKQPASLQVGEKMSGLGVQVLST